MALTNAGRLAAVVEVANQPVFAYHGRHRVEDARSSKGRFRRQSRSDSHEVDGQQHQVVQLGAEEANA
jgi:hypothetical protein